MGMAASQARYLSLTARKTNTEYQGQQVNQERTALANQSAGLFNQMLSLEVPTPPSATDYTKTYYTYNDPALTNTTTIENIQINQDKTQPNGPTYATVKISEKMSQLYANEVNYTSSYDPNNADHSYSLIAPQGDNKNYSIKINGTDPAYTITGPTQNSTVTGVIQEKYGEDTVNEGQQYLEYTANNITYYVPVIVDDGDTYEDLVLGNLNGQDFTAYAIESSTITKTDNKDAILYKADDGTGRYESITILDNNGEVIGNYKLTQQTVQDEDAYDAAMETYTAKKAIYEKQVADINAKTTIIQQQDKTLELHLDQLDTEQQAIQTEMDAVKKVIDKNIEETFKTFA